MQELPFLHSARRLMLVDICMKFHDASLYGLKVTEPTRRRHDFVRDKVQKEITQTSSPKGNDAHLRAIIQSEIKWKHQFFRRLRAASHVVCCRIWLNFKLIQALMYVIITCKYEKDSIKNNREKVATPFS